MKNRLGSAKTALTRYALLWALCFAAGWILYAYAQLPLDSSGRRTMMSLVLTPDQQGQRYLKQQAYKKAFNAYTNPVLKGVALFRAGQFKDAAIAFANSLTPISSFNQGTAYIMSGLYDEAIEAFEQALEADPEFDAARVNLEIAKIRKEKNMPPEDDSGGTGGMLAADEFVFDNRKTPGTDQTEQVENGTGSNEAEMRSLWLRRLETRPKDFLRVKFSYQHAKEKN